MMPVVDRLQRVLPAVPSTVTALRGEVAAFVTAAGLGEPLLSGVKLAVSEAVTNAVQHAYIGRRTGQVRVAAHIEDDRMRVEVCDDGSGIRPRLDSPGLGVGLPFIADTADALDISSSPRGGARLLMTFDLHPAAQHCA